MDKRILAGFDVLMYAATGKELYADCAAESQSATENVKAIRSAVPRCGKICLTLRLVRYRFEMSAQSNTLLAANTLEDLTKEFHTGVGRRVERHGNKNFHC